MLPNTALEAENRIYGSSKMPLIKKGKEFGISSGRRHWALFNERFRRPLSEHSYEIQILDIADWVCRYKGLFYKPQQLRITEDVEFEINFWSAHKPVMSVRDELLVWEIMSLSTKPLDHS